MPPGKPEPGSGVEQPLEAPASMNAFQRLLPLLGLVLLVAGGWPEAHAAQPPVAGPSTIEAIVAEVPRAVVPDRAPVVPAPAASARTLPDRPDRTEDATVISVVVPPVWALRPIACASCAQASGDAPRYRVLQVYRL